MPEIVCVEESNKFAVAARDALVACPRNASVPGRYDLHTRIALGKIARDRRGFVGRSVVDDDHFDIAMALVRRGIQCAKDERRSIASGNDDRDEPPFGSIAFFIRHRRDVADRAWWSTLREIHNRTTEQPGGAGAGGC